MIVRLTVNSKMASYACCLVFIDRADHLGRCQFQEPVHETVKIEGTLGDEELIGEDRGRGRLQTGKERKVPSNERSQLVVCF